MMKSTTILCAGVLLLAAAAPLVADDWSVDWYTIDSGGVVEADDGDTPPQWRLSGTVGQWDATEARAHAAGQWRLTGGFWATRLGEGEGEDDDAIFSDRFETVETVPQSLLNDTGIDWWATGPGGEHFLDKPQPDYPGQDADFGRDALAREGELNKVGGGAAGFDFTKLDDNGDDLPSTAAGWSCVRDNHTGLIWETKVDDDDGDHFRHFEHRYTWYNSTGENDGGHPGREGDTDTCNDTLNGQNCNTENFVSAVNGAELCGASDWRMPSREEMRSIVHYGRSDSPAMDEEYFPNTESVYWSASSLANLPDHAWRWTSSTGGFGGWSKLHQFGSRVRLVRTGK